MVRRLSTLRLALLALVFAAVVPVHSAEDPCAGFTWDVRHERALFGTEGQAAEAGKSLTGAPALILDRLYELQLNAQTGVAFVVPPEKQRVKDDAYAGLTTVRIEAPGTYRIALDQALWVDVLVNGVPIHSQAFQGRPGCNAPHKVVEFALPAGAVTLQLSGGRTATVKVTVTRSPARAS
jgi:hypothetical protein